MQEYFQLARKKAALETAKSEAELADNADYQRLVDRLESVGSEADELVGQVAGFLDLL